MSFLTTIKNGAFSMTHIVDLETCTGCGDCIDICPVESIRMENAKAAIDPETCIDCGICVTECPVTAISAGDE
jgi:NAD-dependent dihydropyrimidine dehydrogenase PreA subunit